MLEQRKMAVAVARRLYWYTQSNRQQQKRRRKKYHNNTFKSKLMIYYAPSQLFNQFALDLWILNPRMKTREREREKKWSLTNLVLARSKYTKKEEKTTMKTINLMKKTFLYWNFNES